MTGGEDPEYADVDPAQSSMELITYAMKMAEERAQEPDRRHRHHADRGRHRRREALRRRVRLLRHHARGGRQRDHPQLDHARHDRVRQNPDQWELYKKERPETAADEIVRWATPVSAFQRTALEDTELGGVQIKKGERVVMSYRSANFDDEVFEDPQTFNILRDPNPHVGFGGTGAHFCIGANLARMTINLIFNAVADHMPDLKPIGEPERLRSGWLNGIKHWQVDYTGASASGCTRSPVAHESRRIRVDFSPDEGAAGCRRCGDVGARARQQLGRAGRRRRDRARRARAPRRRRRRPARDRHGADRDR